MPGPDGPGNRLRMAPWLTTQHTYSEKRRVLAGSKPLLVNGQLSSAGPMAGAQTPPPHLSNRAAGSWTPASLPDDWIGHRLRGRHTPVLRRNDIHSEAHRHLSMRDWVIKGSHFDIRVSRRAVSVD